MSNIALALAFLASAGHGGRLHLTSERLRSRPNSKQQATWTTGDTATVPRALQELKLSKSKRPVADLTAMKLLAETLLARSPAVGWQGVNAGHRSSARVPTTNINSVADYAASAGFMVPSTSYLNQERAIQVDVDLMSPEGGFSIDQLMELAGLSVASAVAKEYPPNTHRRVLIVCGPGNNGGDGLVAARHLHHFGYMPNVIYPKMEKVIANNELYRRLTVQLSQLGIPVSSEWNAAAATNTDVIIDAVFGFSFKGWRGGGKDAPFDDIIQVLATLEEDEASPAVPLVSVDIPSGWDVERGPPDGKALRPDMLISLTAPKQCALIFRGRFHYLGGRFVPPAIVEKNNLDLPAYPGAEQCVKLAATTL